ncbi:multidrug efflux pump [Paraburkholderia youngii]
MSTAQEEGRFNLSAWALRHQALVVFLIALATAFGILAYTRLAQSEDPPFTFRVMVIRTFWPGATARQVQEQLTDRIGRKLQETPYIDFVRSYSRPGESLIFFTMKDSAPVSQVPETWYQVRKKVGDISATLPPGIQGPFFNDEFGDVYTNIYTLEGDGFSAAQLHDYADQLRSVLLRVPGVGKVDYFGDPDQHIYIEIANTQLTRLGISPQQLGQAINAQNAIAPAGTLTTTDDRVFVRPSGQFNDVNALADTLIRINNRTFRLGDIATIRRGYDDPIVTQMRFGGKPVLGIGVTMQPGGDVIRLGRALDQQMTQLRAALPVGLNLVEVSSMPHAVARSVNDFLEAVAEAVAIVLIVSLVSLGVRTGMVVVISIPVVLAVTALCMYLFDIGLHKVSLGTLVLALGLLVDDAIIAVEMMSVKLEQGWNRTRAAAFAYTSTAFPMLTGTLVTVSGFLPIALAKSSTGEYTRSIFEVSAIALIASWLAAVVLIPLLGYHMLPERKRHAHEPDDHEHDIYDTRFYTRLRGWIGWCIERRFVVLAITVLLFVLAMAGFSLVPQQFFPSSDRPELLVDVRLPEGASFDATLRQAQRLEQVLKGRPEIDHSVSFVGTGAPRFYLPLDQQLQQPNFAQFVITAKSVKDREKLAQWLEPELRNNFPAIRTRLSRLENGPPVGYPVQFRVSGDDIATVRSIAERVSATMRANRGTRNVQFDWDEPAERSVRFEIDQKRARELGVTSEDISSFLALTMSGYTVTQYRERDKLISVDLRAPRARTRRPVAADRACDADAERPGAARHPRTSAQRPRIRRDLGTRPPADHHRAVRRVGRRARHRRDPRGGPRARADPRDAAGRLPDRDRRLRRGKRQGSNLDQRADSDHGDRGADAADDPAAKLRARADGRADRAARPDRRRADVAAVRPAVRLRRDARRDRDVRHHHAQLGDSRRSDRAGHRVGAQAFRCDRRRDRAAVPADHADRRRRRARADPALALELLRADGDRADGRHHERDHPDAVLSARVVRRVVPRACRRARAADAVRFRRHAYG